MLLIFHEKPRFESKKTLSQFLGDAVHNKVLIPTIVENVKGIIEAFDVNQIWGRKEIKKERGYSDYKAGKAIEAMRLLNIIIAVEGIRRRTIL